VGGASGERASSELLIRALHAYDGVTGDPRRYGPIAASVVRDARRAADDEALVVALRAVAWSERARRQNLRARTLADEAVRRARRAGLTDRLTEVLVSRAAITLELGRTSAAVRDLDQAGITIGRPSPELEFMRAVLLHNLGRLGAAAESYRRVLADPNATVDNRGSAANNLALIASDQGRYEESLRHLDHAEQLAAEIGPSLYAFVAHNRGLVLAQSGRLAEGMQELDRATELFAGAGLPLGEYVMEHADVLLELRLLPEAREVARSAAAELDAGGLALLAAEAQLALARVALLARDAAAARAAAERAAAQFRRQRRTPWLARATMLEAESALLDGAVTAELLTRTRRAAGVLDRAGMPSVAAAAHLVAGRLAAQLGRTALAETCFRQASERARQGPVLLRVRGRLAAAHAERLAGRGEAVLRHCRAGLADLARHRSALGSMELRALASGHGFELGQLGMETLLRLGSPSRVLAWTELTRAAALLTVEPPAPDAVRNELGELRAVHTELAQALRETGAEPAELRTRQAAAEARIRRATWRRAGAVAGGFAGPAAAPSVARLRGLLGRAALVSYFGLNGELFAIVLTERLTRLVRLGPDAPVQFERDALLFALRRLIRPRRTAAAVRASAEHALRRLAALLIAPLGVPAEVPLVVVPSARTDRMPWSALHTAPVSVSPSAALWARSAEQADDPTGKVVLVAGPRLGGAVAEVDALRRVHSDATVLEPPVSTVAGTVEALAAAKLAHLACHGRLRADNPSFSALELVDGQLTVHELDRRGIAPRQVVLAACDSAADVSFAGDELLGFVSALLARGTAGLVASVVQVGDVEAVDLMRGLHERLRDGETMAVGLHAARAALDPTDSRQFVNWCAFTAYGAG
jgi:tetratricopeptide (TPR) repeat protein